MCETKGAHNVSSYWTNFFYVDEISKLREIGLILAYWLID